MPKKRGRRRPRKNTSSSSKKKLTSKTGHQLAASALGFFCYAAGKALFIHWRSKHGSWRFSDRREPCSSNGGNNKNLSHIGGSIPDHAVSKQWRKLNMKKLWSVDHGVVITDHGSVSTVCSVLWSIMYLQRWCQHGFTRWMASPTRNKHGPL